MIRIYRYGQVDSGAIFARAGASVNVEDVVAEIIAQVRGGGDRALLELEERFDRVRLASLAVTKEELEAAKNAVEPDFLRVLERAAANIREFHRSQIRSGYIITRENGVVLGQRVIPVDRAGLYVPGGTAAYPSTVLMDAIPAKLAGCREVVMVTPPLPDGTVNPAILAAASVAGVDRIFKLGGAQAIAALAYGTESVPRVDKIVGPGNAFVAEAKKQVFGQVSIDMIAGPSEILIVADQTADARHLAADLLSQAEHDRMASAVLVTDSPALAEAVQAEIEEQLPQLLRAEIARDSIENNGKIIVADDLRQVIEIANEIAPEHLELAVERPFDWLDSVRHAGSVFLGHSCPEALGDYLAGPNHTLPTGGTARFSSPLSVDDFVKKSQFIYYTADALADVAQDVASFAEKEGLTAHARSARIRSEGAK